MVRKSRTAIEARGHRSVSDKDAFGRPTLNIHNRQSKDMRLIFTCIFGVSLCLGQEFEVVSIKPNTSMSGSSRSSSDQVMLRGTNLSLRSLILTAYGIRTYQLEGPDWLESQRFDITGKFSEVLPKDREKANAAYQSMMQKMLADRFKVTVHRDRKPMAVYGLLVEKGGIKFKEVPAGHSSSNSHNTHYTGSGVSMEVFAAFLSGQMDLPAINMTGLAGSYDLKLDWVAESQNQANGEPSEPAAGQTIQDAIQDQLGLKIERRKAPVEILIVDHAEKVPTEN
jgi:uncharacterized protein (TIGR03435 family)